MSLELLGIKRGQTRIFTEDGQAVPVTVIEATPNRIVQIKTADTPDGYNAVQLTFGSQKNARVSKPVRMHYAKHEVPTGKMLRECRLDSIDESWKPGDELGLDIFSDVEKVDVCGVSKGKGFAGTVKRWNFHMQDATHGNSLSHRSAGSIGQCQTPGKVWKGKKMAGHMGARRHTQMSLKVERCDTENHLLLVRGSVPGPVGGVVSVRAACKQRELKNK